MPQITDRVAAPMTSPRPLHAMFLRLKY